MGNILVLSRIREEIMGGLLVLFVITHNRYLKDIIKF